MSPKNHQYDNVSFRSVSSYSMGHHTSNHISNDGNSSLLSVPATHPRHGRLSGQTTAQRKSKAEQELERVKGSTGWHIAITYVLSQPGRPNLSELIESLQSQGRDNEQLMIQILGKRGWEAVRAV